MILYVTIYHYIIILYSVIEKLYCIIYICTILYYSIYIIYIGRPDGQIKPSLTLAFAAIRLGEILNEKVEFITDCIGQDVQKAVQNLENGRILLLGDFICFSCLFQMDYLAVKQHDHYWYVISSIITGVIILAIIHFIFYFINFTI